MIEHFYMTTNRTLTGSPNPGQSEPESNSHEGLLHVTQNPGQYPHHQKKFDVILRIINGFKYFNQTLITLSKIIHSFALR